MQGRLLHVPFGLSKRGCEGDPSSAIAIALQCTRQMDLPTKQRQTVTLTLLMEVCGSTGRKEIHQTQQDVHCCLGRKCYERRGTQGGKSVWL